MDLTVKQMAKMGGLATLKKYGKEHFKNMAVKRELNKKRKQIRQKNERV